VPFPLIYSHRFILCIISFCCGFELCKYWSFAAGRVNMLYICGSSKHGNP
jgi:hypothetical protein